MNHDNILLRIFFNKENKIIGGKVARLKRKFPNILSYLNKRYYDSFSLKETLIRMNIILIFILNVQFVEILQSFMGLEI